MTRAIGSRTVLLAVIAAVMAAVTAPAQSQLNAYSGVSTAAAETTAAIKPEPIYVPVAQRTKVDNYLFDAFGPYPIAAAAVAAGVNQLTDSPPEWNQGAAGFGRRFGSDFGMLAVGTTTRYALSEALKEDSLYYRCECQGIIPRFRHAVLSTFVARHSEDGRRVFSFPALVAPYAGSFTAVYGWYPDRFGAKDAFRLGNYSLLAQMGGNVSLEFFYSGAHSLISRVHLNNRHGSLDQVPNN
jgi:hypothetical protein